MENEQTVYVVGIKYEGHTTPVVLVGVCSSMEQVVKQYGTSWRERANVYEMVIDSHDVGRMV
jgi:hypothetical protein